MSISDFNRCQLSIMSGSTMNDPDWEQNRRATLREVDARRDERLTRYLNSQNNKLTNVATTNTSTLKQTSSTNSSLSLEEILAKENLYEFE